jgi:hypothetical protein
MREADQIAAMTRTPAEEGDGFAGYERGAVSLELPFLARDAYGQVYTPLREGRADWPGRAFEDDVGELGGVRARIIGLAALRADKSEAHRDPQVAAKDRADLETLTALD